MNRLVQFLDKCVQFQVVLLQLLVHVHVSSFHHVITQAAPTGDQLKVLAVEQDDAQLPTELPIVPADPNEPSAPVSGRSSNVRSSVTNN